MTRPLADHLALMNEAYAECLAAPLSVRRALAVAVLLDLMPDRVFAQWRGNAPEKVLGAEDLPAYRAVLCERFEALDTIARLGARAPGGPTLEVVQVPVTAAELVGLTLPDFMVCLYNGQRVMRIMVRWPDGRQLAADDLLGAALAHWQRQFAA